MVKQRGFTLIELMITVAVVAILAAIALPSYQEQVRKSRRSEAISTLGELQLRQERWRANNPSYGTQSLITGSSSFNTNQKYYQFAVDDGVSATSYELTAAPKTGSAQADDRCGTYTFENSAGVMKKTAKEENCSL